jgi:hypothetical protein
MLIPLFLCIGFMLAVIYIDLAFDLFTLPYRRNKAALPKEALESITSYYRCITRNPWLLVFVFTATATCIIWEIVYELVPPRIGYLSIAVFGAVMLIATTKVIPSAQRLASGKESDEKRTMLAHSLFPYHVTFLVLIICLAILQFSTVRGQSCFR